MNDIDQVAREAIMAVKPLAYQHNLKLNYHCENAVLVKIDSDKMKQAIMNLIGNALRFASTFIEVKVCEVLGKVHIQIQDDVPEWKMKNAFLSDSTAVINQVQGLDYRFQKQ